MIPLFHDSPWLNLNRHFCGEIDTKTTEKGKIVTRITIKETTGTEGNMETHVYKTCIQWKNTRTIEYRTRRYRSANKSKAKKQSFEYMCPK